MPEEASKPVVGKAVPAIDEALTNRVAALERDIERIKAIMRNHAIY